MKKRQALIIIIFLLVIITGAFVYVWLLPKESADNAENTKPNSSSSETKPTNTDTGAQTQTPAAGKYVDYSEANFAAAADAKRILFFHASWCPQCRALEKSIQEGQIPAGMVILKVDYDSSQSLRQQYGVTLQTTLVEVDNNGALKKKFVAYDEPSLATLTREFGE